MEEASQSRVCYSSLANDTLSCNGKHTIRLYAWANDSFLTKHSADSDFRTYSSWFALRDSERGGTRRREQECLPAVGPFVFDLVRCVKICRSWDSTPRPLGQKERTCPTVQLRVRSVLCLSPHLDDLACSMPQMWDALCTVSPRIYLLTVYCQTLDL